MNALEFITRTFGNKFQFDMWHFTNKKKKFGLCN